MRKVQASYRGDDSPVTLRDLYKNLNGSHYKTAIVPYSIVCLVK